MTKEEIKQLVVDNSIPLTRVYTTTNYEMFGYIKGNRSVNSTNLNNIISSFKQRQVLESAIIVIIDENAKDGKYLFIIDGQHRFQACKELNLPVPYIIMELKGDDALKIIELLNTASKEWDVTCFMGSKAQLNNPNYVLYKSLYDVYPFEHEIFFYVLNKFPNRKRINHQNFKTGDLIFNKKDYDNLKNIFNILVLYLPAIEDKGKRYYLKSLIDLLFIKNLDKEHLDRIMINDKEVFPIFSHVKDCTEYLVKQKYNKGRRRNQIYLYSSGKDFLFEIR